MWDILSAVTESHNFHTRWKSQYIILTTYPTTYSSTTISSPISPWGWTSPTFWGTQSQLHPLLISGTIRSTISRSFWICLNGLAALARVSSAFDISHHSIHSVLAMIKLRLQIVHLVSPDSFLAATFASNAGKYDGWGSGSILWRCGRSALRELCECQLGATGVARDQQGKGNTHTMRWEPILEGREFVRPVFWSDQLLLVVESR